MTPAELRREIAKLTDDDAMRCVQALVKGYAVRHGAEELFVSEPFLLDVVVQYSNLVQAYKQMEFSKAHEVANQRPTLAPTTPPTPRPEVWEADKRPAAARALLEEMVNDKNLCPVLDSWFESKRPTLIDPITAALVLAGIVFILSTDIDMEMKKGADGKVSWKASLKKKPTKETILSKFFRLFGVGGGD